MGSTVFVGFSVLVRASSGIAGLRSADADADAGGGVFKRSLGLLIRNSRTRPRAMLYTWACVELFTRECMCGMR
jgi:hypothetical protein